MISYVLGTVLVTGNKEMDKTHEDAALMQFMFKRQQTENKKYKTQNKIKTQEEKYQIGGGRVASKRE